MITADSIETSERILHEYLSPYGWSMLDVGVGLNKFMDVFGQTGLAAMLRYISFSAENTDESIIAATIGHDLMGCESECFSPRTSGY